MRECECECVKPNGRWQWKGQHPMIRHSMHIQERHVWYTLICSQCWKDWFNSLRWRLKRKSQIACVSSKIDFKSYASVEINQIVQSNYEPLNRNNDCIGQWSWYYRGCWHQTCPPLESSDTRRVERYTNYHPKVLSCLNSPHSNWAHKASAKLPSLPEGSGNARHSSLLYSTVTACHCLSRS